MNRFSRLAPVLLLAGISTVAACRSQPEPEPTPMPTINQDSIDSVNAARAREAAERQRVADSIAAANAARERARADSIAAENRRMEALRATITQPIYFDFDRSEITMQARSTLEQKVPILRANPNLRIRIAGHADERGSDEYNVALGRRRAMAAQRHLTTQGIAENRIEIVSYGEERPVAMGSNESAWSQNRRDEFEIVSGGDRLMSPMQ
jgi:peptidoglycan-associated lipoprotein